MAGRIAFILCSLLWLAPASHLYGADAEPASQVIPLRVLTSFYPVHVATINVIGGADGVAVENMAREVTGCLHEYSPTVADMVRISKADLLVVNGAGMESFLDKAVQQNTRVKIVDASRGIELLQDESGPNAHVWLDVRLHMRQVENIRDGLAAADSGRAETYKANAAAYLRKLEELDGRMSKELETLARREIITFHEAFPYFARAFNLKVVAVIEREPGQEPSAKELAAIITLIRKTGTKAVFAEPQYPAKSAELIARETGITLHTLDPVVTGPVKADAYLEAMEKNLLELAKALK